METQAIPAWEIKNFDMFSGTGELAFFRPGRT